MQQFQSFVCASYLTAAIQFYLIFNQRIQYM